MDGQNLETSVDHGWAAGVDGQHANLETSVDHKKPKLPTLDALT